MLWVLLISPVTRSTDDPPGSLLSRARRPGTRPEKGRLAPGFLADVVVLDADPFVVPAGELKNIKVLLTVVGGRVVFEAPR